VTVDVDVSIPRIRIYATEFVDLMEDEIGLLTIDEMKTLTVDDWIQIGGGAGWHAGEGTSSFLHLYFVAVPVASLRGD
jgi:hypothetical protein